MVAVSTNNKRIAKNTILLYFRMFIIVAVALFTSRVVLQTLGIEDYGIYNVVGGIVSLMGVVNAALVIATQRFITYELGVGNVGKANKIFSASIVCFAILSLIIFVLAETVPVSQSKICCFCPLISKYTLTMSRTSSVLSLKNQSSAERRLPLWYCKLLIAAEGITFRKAS